MLFRLASYVYAAYKKRPCHTSILIGALWVEEILEGHEDYCKFEFHMDPFIFETLANILRQKNLLSNTRSVTSEEQLTIFVYILSKNISNRALQERFRHSGEMIHRHFQVVLNGITELIYDYITLPPTVTHPKINNNYRFWPYFKVYLISHYIIIIL